MFNNHLKLMPSTFAGGEGVFTMVDIPAGVPVYELTGNVLSSTEIVDLNDPAVLQIGHDLFLSASGELDDRLNHSCKPNCRLYIVGKRAFLYSLYVIKAGTELTFDYSTSSTDTHDVWKMDCKCGLWCCRKVVSGYQYLDESIKEEYKKKNMVPFFISEPTFSGRK